MKQLLPYQSRLTEEALGLYKHGKAVYNDSDPGTGKTLMAAELIKRLDSARTLVVCPASVRFSWASEILEHCGITALALPGTLKKKTNLTRHRAVITSYDSAIKENSFKSFLHYRPEFLIFDEAHFLKDLSAQRTKAAAKFFSYSGKVLFLSGTPVDGCIDHFFPILNMVWPDKFPDISIFRQQYCETRVMSIRSRKKNYG